ESIAEAASRELAQSSDAAHEKLAASQRDLAAARAEIADMTARSQRLESVAAALTPRRAAALAAEEGAFAEAEAPLRQELARAPDDAGLHLSLGKLYYRQNGSHAAAAEAALARAAELDKKD